VPQPRTKSLQWGGGGGHPPICFFSNVDAVTRNLNHTNAYRAVGYTINHAFSAHTICMSRRTRAVSSDIDIIRGAASGRRGCETIREREDANVRVERFDGGMLDEQFMEFYWMMVLFCISEARDWQSTSVLDLSWHCCALAGWYPRSPFRVPLIRDACAHFSWEPMRVWSNSNAVWRCRCVSHCRLCLEFYVDVLKFRYGATEMVTCSSRGRSAGIILKLDCQTPRTFLMI